MEVVPSAAGLRLWCNRHRLVEHRGWLLRLVLGVVFDIAMVPFAFRLLAGIFFVLVALAGLVLL